MARKIKVVKSIKQHGQISQKSAQAATHTCTSCSVLNCYRKDKEYPSFCLTQKADKKAVAETVKLYSGKGLDAKLAHAAAEVEGKFYGRLTRAEEIVAFARRIGAKKIGNRSRV